VSYVTTSIAGPIRYSILIWLLCGIAIFVIAVLGDILCPTQHVYALGELQNHGFTSKLSLVAIRGEVFDLTKIAKVHQPAVVSTLAVEKYAGTDATALFPQQLSSVCNGISGSVSPWLTLASTNASDSNAIYHDFRYSTSLLDVRPDWYTEQMIYMRSRYRTGFMAYTDSDVSNRAAVTDTRNTVILDNYVYDMTTYIANNGGIALAPNGTRPPDGIDTQFMHPSIISLSNEENIPKADSLCC